MAKLSYVNRKSEWGIKLGKIVARDLRKRAKPATSSSSDAHKDVAPVELNLDGKLLTDRGLREATDGLLEALTAADAAHSTRLQVLNLAGNCLTVEGLVSIAPCIRAAAADLEELDLSNNIICVSNDNEAAYWEEFLQSFATCRILKKINLSGNNLSGAKALEIFYKVYGQQFPRMEARLDPHTSDTICGLHRVESIMLSNTSMTDAGALFLSYVLSQHSWSRERLGVRSETTVDQGSSPHGFVYIPNKDISGVGIKLLKLAESVPYDPFENPQSPSFPPTNTPVVTSDATPGSRQRNPSRSHHREPSNGISTSAQAQLAPKATPFHLHHTPWEELESNRWKVQRAVLEESGPNQVQLWEAAFSMLLHTRQLLSGSATTISGSPPPHSGLAMANGDSGFASKLLFDTTSSDTSFAIIGVSDEPVTPQVHRQLRKRRDSFSVGSDTSPPYDHRLPNLRGPIRLKDKEIRMFGSIPEDAWKLVIEMHCDPASALSVVQKQAIFKYGMDKQTLAQERGLLGKPDSFQMWKVLDAMRCLTYEEGF